MRLTKIIKKIWLISCIVKLQCAIFKLVYGLQTYLKFCTKYENKYKHYMKLFESVLFIQFFSKVWYQTLLLKKNKVQ